MLRTSMCSRTYFGRSRAPNCLALRWRGSRLRILKDLSQSQATFSTAISPPVPRPRRHCAQRARSLSTTLAKLASTSSPEMSESNDNPTGTTPQSFYNLKAALPGEDKYLNFEELRGKVVLVVNVASQWSVSLIIQNQCVLTCVQRIHSSV